MSFVITRKTEGSPNSVVVECQKARLFKVAASIRAVVNVYNDSVAVQLSKTGKSNFQAFDKLNVLPIHVIRSKSYSKFKNNNI